MTEQTPYIQDLIQEDGDDYMEREQMSMKPTLDMNINLNEDQK